MDRDILLKIYGQLCWCCAYLLSHKYFFRISFFRLNFSLFTSTAKAPGTFGKHVVETLYFLLIFPCFLILKNIVAETGSNEFVGKYFCFPGRKNMSQQIQKHFRSESNVSLRLYVSIFFPAQEHQFLDKACEKQCLKTSANISNNLRFT